MGRAQRKNKSNTTSLDGLDSVFDSDESHDSVAQAVDRKSVEMLFQDQDEVEADTDLDGKDCSSEEQVDNSKTAEATPAAQVKDQAEKPAASGEAPGNTAVARRTESEDEKGLGHSLVDADDRVSRRDLLNILEGFARLLKKDGEMSVPTILEKQYPSEDLRYTEVDIEDKTAELEDMRRLVIEAQETIIKLLTDRIEDRAQIATLETELRLLPDLQEQADRAMAVAFKTEEFRTELHKMKFELEKNRIANVRKQMYKGPRGVLTRVQRWFLKARGRSQLQFNDEMKRLNSTTGNSD
ncbi:MAG: hypothetical protein K8F91_13735 [Candidatus Obscuribacterales bacterium]|nr:hypothetical protein [Candidatus Obscuribacterales bacterium]